MDIQRQPTLVTLHRNIAFEQPQYSSMATSEAADDTELPPICAVFLIRFDPRSGYTVAWKESLPTVEVDGVVEYKSLPSGSHNVKEDLVYFVHGDNAGLAAFKNAPAAESERNASFVSVGILAPQAGGRLGRVWLHATRLQQLAVEVLKDVNNTKPLETYWSSYRLKEEDSAGTSHTPGSKHRKSRNRAMSESVALSAPSQSLSHMHPALSTLDLLDKFGPLIFPVYRAALLRKRILLISKPPVRKACEFVYILSVLSSIPFSVAEVTPERLARIRTLFYTGIHDIPELENLTKKMNLSVYRDVVPEGEDQAPTVDDIDQVPGWIACTSDELFATKDQLYDIKIAFPGLSSTTKEESHQWPTITDSEFGVVKATQRDLRRYRTLRQGLLRMSDSSPPSPILTYNEERRASNADNARLLQRRPSTSQSHKTTSALIPESIPGEENISESLPWVAAMYDAAIWWASAGEKSTELQEESDADASLLRSASEVWSSASGRLHHESLEYPISTASKGGAVEMAVVAYFHKMTAKIVSTLADLSEPAYEDEDDDDYDRGNGTTEAKRIIVYKDDLVRMGLDVWSKSDRDFVKGLASLYMNTDAGVEGASIECCGVKIY